MLLEVLANYKIKHLKWLCLWRMQRCFIPMKNRASRNHANLKPEANMMGLYSNAVILHKRKLNLRENMWLALSIQNKTIFFILAIKNIMKSRNCILCIRRYLLNFALKNFNCSISSTFKRSNKKYNSYIYTLVVDLIL